MKQTSSRSASRCQACALRKLRGLSKQSGSPTNSGSASFLSPASHELHWRQLFPINTTAKPGVSMANFAGYSRKINMRRLPEQRSQ